MARIDIVCSQGSPIGIVPTDVEDRGIGGAELALVSFAEVMARRKHVVQVYNNPKRPGVYDDVNYLPLSAYNAGEQRDVLIVFRTPFAHLQSSRAGVKIFWSCDQFTTGNFKTAIFPFVDKIVTISPYHSNYFRQVYGADEAKLVDIGLGVRTWEYDASIPKIPGRMIFCSIPDRGLTILRQCWDEILDHNPEASLIITSDYRLWDPSFGPGNHPHRLAWVGARNVEFIGMVPRHELVKLQSQAVLFPYPCIYEELFCISVAECQVAGCVPITSTSGALETTNIFGDKLAGDPKTNTWQRAFVDRIRFFLSSETTAGRAEICRSTANGQFDWNIIALMWEGFLQ